jgi:hypothetical protein
MTMAGATRLTLASTWVFEDVGVSDLFGLIVLALSRKTKELFQ